MNRLKDLRNDQDLSREEACKIAYISAKSLERYEKEERDIPLGIAILFARYYNVSLDYLAGLTNDKRKYW